jgi:hypothetical protein
MTRRMIIHHTRDFRNLSIRELSIKMNMINAMIEIVTQRTCLSEYHNNPKSVKENDYGEKYIIDLARPQQYTWQ